MMLSCPFISFSQCCCGVFLELLNLEQNSLTGEMPSEVCALREGALESLSVNCEVDCQCCTFCG